MIFPNGTIARTRVRLSTTMMWAAGGSLLFGLALFVLAETTFDGAAPLVRWGGGVALLAAFALGITSYVTWFRQAPRAGHVELDDDSLLACGAATTLRVPRAEIRSAVIVDRPVGGATVPHVEVDLASGDRLTIGVTAGEDVARALLAELGFGPGERRVRLDLGSPARRLFHPLLGYGLYQVLNLVFSVAASVTEISVLATLPLPLAILGYLALRRAVRAPVVTIGDDGLLWEAGWRRRFVPLRDVLSVEQLHPTMLVAIELRHGGTLRLAGAALDLQRSTAAGRVLRERLARLTPGAGATNPAAETSPAPRAAHYARGQRTVAGWRAALAAMRDASYRGPTASVEDMTAVLTSPLATPEERVGAALALRIAGEPPARIRVAAEAVASEPLREALAAAAESDDATLDVALRRLGA